MRISYEWLKTMVDGPESPEDLISEFVRTGTEVEGVERTGEAFDHIYVGHVISKEPHPDSDHMSVCMVDVGSANTDKNGNPEPLQIVCGATNFKQGDKIVTATVGAEFGDFKIKKSKLRGVQSFGMNCSEKELGLASESCGIMILPEDAPVGMPFADYYGLSDTILDCEITPNRPDCLSMMGVAREVSAIFDTDLHIDLPMIEEESDIKAEDELAIKIEDAELCSRYVGCVLHNVKVGPSPEWLARRVTSCGARSVNNVVDVTNYVMYLTGQPLHAFDLAKLGCKGDKQEICVRRAHPGEKITTLDEVERELSDDMIVIADGNDTACALAGVMGGLSTEVDDSTSDILIESASFNSGHISRTSRNLNLMSESSIRFERQVDSCGCDLAASIAAALLQEVAGGMPSAGLVDLYPNPAMPCEIVLHPARVRSLCGADITTDDMLRYLGRLGCDIAHGEDKGEEFIIVVPGTRPDLTREIDLVEEILRLWGMDRVVPTLPAAKNHAGGLTVDQLRMRKIGSVLRGCGLNETSTYCFADASDLSRLGMSEDGRGIAVEIINPLVADQSQMRRSIIPGLLRSVSYNLAHGIDNVALYEIGRVFFGDPEKSQPEEPTFVSAVMCGKWQEDGWNVRCEPLDFFDGKGVCEELISALRIQKVRFVPADPDKYTWLQPGRAAEIVVRGKVLGWVGNIHPLSLAHFDIDEDVIAFELDCKELLARAHRELPYEDIPVLPGVEVDLAIVVDEDVDYEMLSQRIKSAGGKYLDSVHLFDVYRDLVRVGKNKKSCAFNLVYRDPDKTLTTKQVEKIHAKLIQKVCKSTGGEVRA